MADFLDSSIAAFTPIAVDTGGLFTPASAAAINMAEQLVNKCVELAEAKDIDLADKVAALDLWLTNNAAAVISAGVISAPTPTEPSMTIGDTSTALVFNNFTTQAGAILTSTMTKFTDFMTAYFPDNTATYTAAEAYLLARITNTTTGAVPAAIQAAILASDRARILAEENRAVADLYESPAARRHRFPSGAQQAQALRIAQSALDAIAASSRTVAVKDFELSHQTALEAVRIAVSSRASALQAATQYIASVVAQGYTTGTALTGAAHGAEVAKIQAAYQAFAGRTAAAELALKASQADETLTFEAAKANQSAELEQIANHLKAFLADAQIIGHEVVSMLNNLRVGSSLTMGVSA